MNREYHKWYSPRMHRDMELLVFGHSGTKILVFPTRQGRFYDYENWGQVAALSQQIEDGRMQLFCVDSADSESLYCSHRSPSERVGWHKRYEEYLLNEVLPFAGRRNPYSSLTVHGCSIGAYHAVNIALRHPAHFNKVVAFSGRYDLTRTLGNFRDLFDGYYDEDIYFHTPNHFLPSLNDEGLLSQMRRVEVVLAVGQADVFAGSNLELSQKLSEKGVRNMCALWEGEAHKARYWREMAKSYLT